MTSQPKTKGKQYVPFGLIAKKRDVTINKCEVKIVDNKLNVDNREVNSFLLKDNDFVVIKAQHFTSKERASDVRTYRRFIPSNKSQDNYVYFIEDGFYDLPKDEIRHISGAASAEIKFEVRFSVEIRFVWLKIEKGHPVKFAIEHGLQPDEIIGSLNVERVLF